MEQIVILYLSFIEMTLSGLASLIALLSGLK
jgi:hypothetical protein